MVSEYTKYRMYEILPGALIWIAISTGVLLSFFAPIWMIYFVIVYDIYWVHRVVYFSLFLTLSLREYRRALRTDWFEKLQKEKSQWREYVHAIFLPVYNEDESVVRSTLEGLLKSSLPAKQMLVVLAGEERKLEHFESFCYKLKEEYGDRFFEFLVTIHPSDLPDEIPGKGSNIHYAGKKVQEYVDARGIAYDRVIVSAFDIDTIVHPHYFSALSYTYLSVENPTRASYQPFALYNNNMWESPAVLRIMAFGTTFWLLTELPRVDRMVTFSSHSMSFRALVDVGFWEKRIVSEDSRIYWQCVLKYDGDYRTYPIFLPVSMDTVRDETFWRSVKNLYKQQRRWAWGTEHIPFMFWNLPKHPAIPWRRKLYYMFNLIEGKFSWGMTAIILLVFGRLPLLVAGDEVRSTVLFQNTPHILEWLMGGAMLGLLFSMTYSLLLLPPRPSSVRSFTMLVMILQWLLLPISLICMSAVPAIDAQTRLMFGKYLGFNVSAKKRKIITA